MDLRPLTDADASEFQRLRLQGLQESPSSFGSSHQEEVHRTLDQVRQHISGSAERVFLGLFTAGELVGMVGVGREQGLKERHIAFIRSMYVAPQARSRGAGRQLLAAALQRARSWRGVEQVTLSVTVSNEAAVRLYKSAGFMEVGRMPRELKMGPNYFDELMMVRISWAQVVWLDAINAGKSPAALNVPGFDLHGLQGKPKRYSVHVNGPWWITFEWQGENAMKVDLENYH